VTEPPAPFAGLLRELGAAAGMRREKVAASHHGDTPYSGNSLTSVPVTPYTTSVDVNRIAPSAMNFC
jgi:hypothetical protein